jgi:DNA-binding response OmpR family regulator
MRVLVVEDFEVLARSITTGLRREGMAVDVVLDGTDALSHLAVTRYDVIVLDRDLPGVHGDEICRRLVTDGADSRVLMLTASSTVKDRVDGLGLGADDYLPKPFDFAELVARVRALGRRSTPLVPPILAYQDISLVLVGLWFAWQLAGLYLRPLRTLNATARDISATNLHRRLGLQGPDDEITALGSTLDDLFGRLESSFESQRRFVANASHELRTPLAGQRTLLQVALADPDASTQSLRAACEDALALGERQTQLVDGLLTLASSERGIERREPIDLAEIADRVLVSRHQAAAGRGIDIRASLNPRPLPVIPSSSRAWSPTSSTTPSSTTCLTEASSSPPARSGQHPNCRWATRDRSFPRRMLSDSFSPSSG